MKLTNAQLATLRKYGVVVEKATRFETAFWNSQRGADEPRIYGGYYWWLRKGGRAETDLLGPFRSEMAAFSAAYDEVVLGRRGKRLVLPSKVQARSARKRAA